MYLAFSGIKISDQPKARNLGYILQEDPVQYTFKLDNRLKTYQVVYPHVERMNDKSLDYKYKKTIMLDYDEWRIKPNTDNDFLKIKEKLADLVSNRKIKEVLDPIN